MCSKYRIAPSMSLGIVMIVAMLLGGCGGGGNDGSNTGGTALEILIVPSASQKGPDAYTPNSPTVHIGDTVIWRNNDETSHTVTSNPPNTELSSESISPGGGTFSHTFTTVGTFNYHCATPGHNMTGSVVVSP